MKKIFKFIKSCFERDFSKLEVDFFCSLSNFNNKFND
jgi:hypothetical protein